MFDWPVEVAKEIRSELIELYWLMLGVIIVLAIIGELFKVSEKRPNPNDILKRVVISMILLWSFGDVINMIGMVTDGIVEKMGGMANLDDLLAGLGKTYEAEMPGMFKFRQMLLYVGGLACYAVSLLGYYLIEVLINFVYTVLYILSPLLILAYVPESTSFVTKNLYRGLLQVALWKILWCIMGALLVKLSSHPLAGGWDNYFMRALLNLFVGISLLTIPLFAKGLLTDGLASFASGIAGASTVPVAQFMSRLPINTLKKGGKEIFTGFSGTRKFSGRRVTGMKKRVKKTKKKLAGTRDEARKNRTNGGKKLNRGKGSRRDSSNTKKTDKNKGKSIEKDSQ